MQSPLYLDSGLGSTRTLRGISRQFDMSYDAALTYRMTTGYLPIACKCHEFACEVVVPGRDDKSYCECYLANSWTGPVAPKKIAHSVETFMQN
jgi:hypothetical protein